MELGPRQQGSPRQGQFLSNESNVESLLVMISFVVCTLSQSHLMLCICLWAAVHACCYQIGQSKSGKLQLSFHPLLRNRHLLTRTRPTNMLNIAEASDPNGLSFELFCQEVCGTLQHRPLLTARQTASLTPTLR